MDNEKPTGKEETPTKGLAETIEPAEISENDLEKVSGGYVVGGSPIPHTQNYLRNSNTPQCQG